MMKIPDLQLSLGQLAWSLNFGQKPPQHFFDRLSYLRQIGIPFAREKKPSGPGNRLTYSYEDLIECGIALYALDNGMKPKDLKLTLIENRNKCRSDYRMALELKPEGALNETWVKSRGTQGVASETDIFLRLHDRYSSAPDKIETILMDETNANVPFTLFGLTETYPDGTKKRLVPLTSLAMQWTAWALEAPILKTGPKS